MQNKLRKIIALLLALAMVFSLSVAAFALDPPGGSGTGVLDDPDPTENQQERPEEESAPEPDPPIVAQGTQGVVEDTRTVGVTLSKGAYSSDQFVDANHTYKAVKILDLYKVMDADGVNQAVDGDSNPIWQYRIADEWAGASELAGLLNDNGFKFDADTGMITMANDDVITSQKGINENTSNAAKLATVLAQYVSLSGFTGTSISLNSSTQLECGYYVIYESTQDETEDGSVATKPILLDAKYDAAGIAVTLKDAKVELTKEIVNDDTYSAKQNVAAFGDEIEYEITTNFPIYEADAFANAVEPEPDFKIFKAAMLTPTQSAAQFVIHDELDRLELLDDSMIVTVDGIEIEEGEETYNIEYSRDFYEFTISFAQDFILAHQGDSIVINYSAILYGSYINSEVGNKNNVTVQYSRNPEVSNDVTSLVDETQTFLFSINLMKIDGASEELLEGVEFEMYDADNNLMLFFYDEEEPEYGYTYVSPDYHYYEGDEDYIVSTITTSGEDTILLLGLDEGTYKLVEKNPVEGYAILGNDAIITITANEGENSELTLYRGQTVESTLDGSATVTSQYATLLEEGEHIEDEGNVANIDNTNEAYDVSSNVFIIIRNYKGVSLPETGSFAAIAVSASGAIMAICGVAYIALKKKED